MKTKLGLIFCLLTSMLFAQITENQKKAKNLHYEAINKFENKEYDSSIQKINQATSLIGKKTVSLSILKIKALTEKGAFAKAKEEYKQLCEIYSRVKKYNDLTHYINRIEAGINTAQIAKVTTTPSVQEQTVPNKTNKTDVIKQSKSVDNPNKVNNSEINWLSFEKAMLLNKENPKPILVDLYTDWCGWCKRMDATTYKNKTLIAYINNHYYAVKLNGESKKTITFKGKTFKYRKQGRSRYHELAAAIMNGKLSYPSTAFFNSEEQLIQTIPGYLTDKKFEAILAYFKEDAYKKTPWANFEKNFKSAM